MCHKTIGAVAWVTLFCWTSSASADLIHQWEFEDSFEDSVGDLDGAPIGNASITDDARIGDGALVVGGGGDYVEAPDSDDLKFTALGSYTVTAWAKAAPSNGWRGVVNKGRDSPPWFGIWINPGNRWVYGVSGNNLAGSPVQFDVWVHTAVVQDGEAGTRDLYVDGRIVASEIARDGSNFGVLYIGGAASVNEWFIGQIDEVRIYDEALDEEGILESMALPPPDCADGPDTHCEGFTVTDADGNPVSAGSTHPAGSFEVQAQAGDDSGDPIRYTLSADNGVDPPADFASGDGTFPIQLGPGAWTLSVTVDDKSGCDDVAADSTCVGDPFTVEAQETELVHQWNFEDGFADSVGSADGIPMGNAEIIDDDPAVGEQALNLTGLGDHVLVDDPADGSLHFTAFESFSVTAWVKEPFSTGGWRGVVTKGRDNPPWYGLWINPGDRWTYGATGGGGTGGPSVPTDVWTHLAIVQNGALGTSEIWVDGLLQGSGQAADATSDSALFIGGAGGIDEWFTGQIDDVRVYHGPLDAAGVAASMEPVEVDCADGPDTHCQGFTVTDADGNPVSAGSTHDSGAFTVEVQAGDDSGDPIRYTLSADNGVDPPRTSGSRSATFQVLLPAGAWTLSVTVDDKAGCDDAADDNTCVGDLFTVETPEPELVHRWDFEDDFGDSVGTADGTPMGLAAIFEDDAAVGEQSLSVTGFGDHVLVDDPADGSLRFTAVESYSVTAWVKEPFSTGGWRGVVTKGRESPPWYGIWINPGDQWVYGTIESNGLGGPLVEADVWIHVAIVQNGGLGTRELWVNGILQGSEIARDATSDSPLFIGGAGGIDEWFTGQIDDVRIYRGALDEEGVKRSMEDIGPRESVFKRGDTDASGVVDISDPIFNLTFQFVGGIDEFLCEDAADVDNSGVVDISDPIYNLTFQFVGGIAPPPPPGPTVCGPDPTDLADDLGCESYPAAACAVAP